MHARVAFVAAIAGTVSICGSALAVNGVFLPGDSNLTGTTTGSYTPVGGGAQVDIFGGTTQNFTSTTATGGTSGGQVDGPAFARANFNASIAALRAGGPIQVRYEYSGLARFDTANFTGSVGSAFIGHVVFQIDEATPFFLNLGGSAGNDSVQFRALTGTIDNGMLSPGIYEFLHNGGVFATSFAGGAALDQTDFVVVLTLPSAGTASLALVAMGFASRRRRRD